MSHKRIPKRKAAIAAGSVVALGAAVMLLPNANASQDGSSNGAAAPKTLKATDASDLAAQLQTLLGQAFAGSYYDAASKQLVVNVVSGSSNQVVVEAKKAGAQVREVKNSLASLKSGAQTLKAKAAIPGTAWAIDPKTNKLAVTADRSVTGAKWARLTSTVKSLGGGMATVKKTSGKFKTLVSGGDAIFAQAQGGTVRCSLGFNVTAKDGSPAFLTAGHCGVAAKQWSDSQTGKPIATVDQATFPGNGDFSLVKYDDPNTKTTSDVNVGGGQTVQITKAADATVGEQVFRMGSTTGLHNGQVTGLDPKHEMYFMEHSRKVRAAVKMPLAYLGGVKSIAGIDEAMAEGFDCVVMARALIHDPQLVNKFRSGEATITQLRLIAAAVR